MCELDPEAVYSLLRELHGSAEEVDLLRHRTQLMEVLEAKKSQAGRLAGGRTMFRHRHIYDLEGLTSQCDRRALQSLIAVARLGSEYYPECLER